jgi:hypothetical protein
MLLTEGTFSTDAYDCFIAGSGPAGISLALALGELRKRVLIFETGEEQVIRHELSNTIGYGHYSGGYWNPHWSRTLGGTSNVWAGWCTVPRELDFDNPAVGVRWPLGRGDLLQYWKRAAPILDQDPTLLDFEKPLFSGFAYRPLVVGPATRFGIKYLAPLRESKLVDVLPGCSVVALDATESRSAVTGVRYFDHKVSASRRFAIKPAQSVVLAAGGIGNAQLLQQPPSDGSVPVGNESGHVGRFLMEHPLFTRVGECVIDMRVERHWPGGSGVGIHGLVADRSLSLEHGLHACNLQFSHRPGDHPMRQYLSAELGRPVNRYVLMARLEMLPSPTNRVFLTGERDASGLYRPAARCILNGRDFLNVEMTVRVLGEALIRLGRGRVRVNNDRI